MTLVDSCGWLEYLVDGPLADKYERFLRKIHDVVVPTIVLYEVYKKIKRETDEEHALMAIAQMEQARVVPLKENIALLAADLSLQFSLPMADAVVYATAKIEGVTVVSGDEHFKNLEHVHFIS